MCACRIRSRHAHKLAGVRRYARHTRELTSALCTVAPRSTFAHDHELYCLRRHYYDPFRRLCDRTYSFLPCRACAAVTRPQWVARNLFRPIVSFIEEMRGVKTFVPAVYIKDNLVKNGFAPESVKVLYPLFVKPFREEASSHTWMPDGKLRVLFMGQIIAGKALKQGILGRRLGDQRIFTLIQQKDGNIIFLSHFVDGRVLIVHIMRDGGYHMIGRFPDLIFTVPLIEPVQLIQLEIGEKKNNQHREYSKIEEDTDPDTGMLEQSGKTFLFRCSISLFQNDNLPLEV